MYDNEHQLLQDMKDFGIELRRGDDIHTWIDRGYRTCGKGGKFWYRLHSFAPAGTTRRFITGMFGSYKTRKAVTVEWDKESLTDELREQFAREAAEKRERERIEAEQAHAMAALSAGEHWHRMARQGESEYLQRKGVEPEACRFLNDWLRIARRNPAEKPITLPPGTLAIPLIRYDLPKEEALRGLQFIKPDGFKFFTEGFGKNGCSVRLGEIDEWTQLLLACEGYATGLSIRMAIERAWPVFVCLDAYNLGQVVPRLRVLYPAAFILVCADDDWKTEDHHGPNPGRGAARRVAKGVERCEVLAPVFDVATRAPKDTDFNDLHQRQGLAAVSRQLGDVIKIILERASG